MDRHTDTWTAAGLVLAEWHRHMATKQWWDLNVTWLSGKKKIPNIKYFLIHPPSCCRLEQNGSIVLWGLLKAEPAQGKEGLHIPQCEHTPKPNWGSCKHPVWIQG